MKWQKQAHTVTWQGHVPPHDRIFDLFVATKNYWHAKLIEEATGEETIFLKRLRHQWTKDPERRYRYHSRHGQEQDFSLAAHSILRRHREHGDMSQSTLNRAMQALIQEAYDRGYEQGADDNY